MAIRFVDKEPEKARAKPGTERRDAVAPDAAIEAGRAIAAAVSPVAPAEAAGELPGLPHAKPAPKARGRKAPSSAGHKDTGAAHDGTGREPDAAGHESLLPGLQLHAKPTPKPRGRKKAFG